MIRSRKSRATIALASPGGIYLPPPGQSIFKQSQVTPEEFGLDSLNRVPTRVLG